MAQSNKTSSKSTASKPQSDEGRFAYEGLDRILHEKARLGILTSLSARPAGLLFNDLKQLCALTDGNLNRHLAVLIDAGIIEAWKNTSTPSRSQTLYRLSDSGRQRFEEYINVLEAVVRDAAAIKDAATEPGSTPARLRWSAT